MTLGDRMSDFDFSIIEKIKDALEDDDEEELPTMKFDDLIRRMRDTIDD